MSCMTYKYFYPNLTNIQVLKFPTTLFTGNFLFEILNGDEHKEMTYILKN